MNELLHHTGPVYLGYTAQPTLMYANTHAWNIPIMIPIMYLIFNSSPNALNRQVFPSPLGSYGSLCSFFND